MLLINLDPRAAALIRLAGLALISWTVLNAAHHGPGTSGRGLVVSLSFAASVAGWLGMAARGWRRVTVADDGGAIGPELWVLAVAGGLLTGACPSSAASAFVFVGVVTAAVRTELPSALKVALGGAFALAVSVLLYDGSALGALAYALGFAATLLAGSNSRQSVVRADQAELLLAQTQRSHEEQLRAARLEQSTRIARDIHDVLAHTLAGLAIQLEATATLVEQGADREALLSRVRRAHELAREGLIETRRAVGALRGEHDPGSAAAVAAALDALVAHHRGSAGGPVELTVDGDDSRLVGVAGEAVIRIAQESLTNVRKHAPGAAVTVILHAGAGSEPIVLVVEDRVTDGQVASPLARTGGGFGVRGMRERAAELGGSLSAGAITGGWRVELRLPAPVVQDVAMEPAR